VSALAFQVRTAQLTPSTYVISVSGEIDVFTSPALEQELEWVLGVGGTNAIVDLGEVGFLDSTALTVLLEALRRFSRRGGALILVSNDRRVLRTLEITGLDRNFVVEARLAEALVRLADPGVARNVDGEEALGRS
jgi:anti-sigma B factor antagonist